MVFGWGAVRIPIIAASSWHDIQEGGLLGSQAIAKDYESRNMDVFAMSQVCGLLVFVAWIFWDQIWKLQFDMTAWVKRGTREEVGIITDFGAHPFLNADDLALMFLFQLMRGEIPIWPYTESL